MVKGISRQVIVVHAPEPKMFEQAIFILKDDAVNGGLTEEMLMKEAMQAIHTPHPSRKRVFYLYGAFWAIAGAMAVSLIWLASILL